MVARAAATHLAPERLESRAGWRFLLRQPSTSTTRGLSAAVVEVVVVVGLGPTGRVRAAAVVAGVAEVFLLAAPEAYLETERRASTVLEEPF